jgi:hypothetical protein
MAITLSTTSVVCSPPSQQIIDVFASKVDLPLGFFTHLKPSKLAIPTEMKTTDIKVAAVFCKAGGLKFALPASLGMRLQMKEPSMARKSVMGNISSFNR